MPQELWQKQLSTKQPVIFRAENGLRLELHGCSLRDSGAAASRLYVSVGEKRLALGSVSTTRPFCPIRFTSLSPETTFSCEGGELLLSGVVLNDDMYDDFAEPPSKKPRMEAPAETPRPASPKAAPKAKAAAPSPKAATPAPKAATPAPAPKKEAKASDKAVTQRTLPSGLRYEVLQRGNGPQAIVGKPVKVRYEGRLGSTGGRFDKGVIKFRLGMGEVIDGWDQGVKGMLQGERRRLLVPAKLGYGRAGAPPAIPPNANLVFEVELL